MIGIGARDLKQIAIGVVPDIERLRDGGLERVFVAEAVQPAEGFNLIAVNSVDLVPREKNRFLCQGKRPSNWGVYCASRRNRPAWALLVFF